MTLSTMRALSLPACLLATATLPAQFAEGFDSSAADVTILAQPDTAVTFVDYSNMTIGATTFSVPEAPRPIAGSAPTRGVLLQANIANGAAVGVNILAGATPITFSGRYRLSFDAWINIPLPAPTGSTEQLLWGVGTDGTGPIEARNNRGAGAIGVWGWLAGDNGYGTEDAAINLDDTEPADLGDTQPGEAVQCNQDFSSKALGGPNGAPANQWVRVDIEVDAGGVRVFYNGIEFFDETGLAPSGFAMLGYEDPFSSVGGAPDGQWGLLDNFRVTLPSGCGAPGTAVTQGTASAGEILNGSAPPAVSAPLTLRLRGALPNTPTILVMADPAPATIPLNLGACTIGIELVNYVGAAVYPLTDADGGAQFSVVVPNMTMFCGQVFAFQYF